MYDLLCKIWTIAQARLGEIRHDVRVKPLPGTLTLALTHSLILRFLSMDANSLVLLLLLQVLPYAMLSAGLDEIHSGAVIQVFMDIYGVSVTCLVCWSLWG